MEAASGLHHRLWTLVVEVITRKNYSSSHLFCFVTQQLQTFGIRVFKSSDTRRLWKMRDQLLVRLSRFYDTRTKSLMLRSFKNSSNLTSRKRQPTPVALSQWQYDSCHVIVRHSMTNILEPIIRPAHRMKNIAASEDSDASCRQNGI